MILIDRNIQHAATLLCNIDDVLECDARDITNEYLCRVNPTAILVRSPTMVNRQLLSNTNIRFIGSATAGVDHIDLDYLQNNQISFSHAPGSNSNAVAEYVICSILGHVPNPQNLICGIVGFGNIGSKVAHYANVLGMTVLVNDPPRAETGLTLPSYCTPCSLEEVMSASHVVTLHIPYTTTGEFPTHQRITEQLLWRLCPDALFINTSRGGIVDEKTLLTRHSMQRITAVLDVYNNEPQPNANVIRAVQHCTPHVAGYTANAKVNGAIAVVNAYLSSKGLGGYSIGDLPIDIEPQSPLSALSVDEARALLLKRRPLLADAEYFRNRWLADPTVLTFDSCRSSYPLRMETLTTI